MGAFLYLILIRFRRRPSAYTTACVSTIRLQFEFKVVGSISPFWGRWRGAAPRCVSPEQDLKREMVAAQLGDGSGRTSSRAA